MKGLPRWEYASNLYMAITPIRLVSTPYQAVDDPDVRVQSLDEPQQGAFNPILTLF